MTLWTNDQTSYENLKIFYIYKEQFWWKKQFFNTYKFSNHSIKKFILLSWEIVYPCEYIDDWKKFNETSLPKKEDFRSQLNMEDIANTDYMHAKRVSKGFEVNKLWKYHDLYVKSDALLSGDLFENFQNMLLDIYHLDSAHFLTSSELAWQATLKKAKVKLGLLTDIDKLLMVESHQRQNMSCYSLIY